MEHGGGEIVCKPPSPVRRHAHRCRRRLPVRREQATASSWAGYPSTARRPPTSCCCKNREPGWDGGHLVLPSRCGTARWIAGLLLLRQACYCVVILTLVISLGSQVLHTTANPTC